MTHEFLDLPQLISACGTVRLPGSKSISNRVLLLAALAEGETEVRDLLASDDTERMLDALRTLGVGVTSLGGESWRIAGCGGKFPVRQAELFLGNAGTAFRPLTAALALAGGDYVLKGVARMHERPIGDLVDGLRQLGADINYLGNAGYPPLHLKPAAIRAGGTVRVRGDVSSQFLTGLLMALPLTGETVAVNVVGELISRPYIEITLATMARFGVVVEREGWQRFTVKAGSRYVSPGTVYVEGDASSASYFLGAGAIGGGPVRVEGVGRDSIQGDVKFAEALAQMGALHRDGAELDGSAGAGRWTGRGRPRLQPHSRCGDDAGHGGAVRPWHDDAAQHRQLAGQGNRPHRGDGDRVAQAWCRGGGGRRFHPRYAGQLKPAAIDTYDDHRMAMCFSLAAFGTPLAHQ